MGFLVRLDEIDSKVKISKEKLINQTIPSSFGFFTVAVVFDIL